MARPEVEPTVSTTDVAFLECATPEALWTVGRRRGASARRQVPCSSLPAGPLRRRHTKARQQPTHYQNASDQRDAHTPPKTKPTTVQSSTAPRPKTTAWFNLVTDTSDVREQRNRNTRSSELLRKIRFTPSALPRTIVMRPRHWPEWKPYPTPLSRMTRPCIALRLQPSKYSRSRSSARSGAIVSGCKNLTTSVICEACDNSSAVAALAVLVYALRGRRDLEPPSAHIATVHLA